MSGDENVPPKPATSRRISFELWAALLFVPLEIPIISYIAIYFSSLYHIPYLSVLSAKWMAIDYTSLLMPLVFIALLFIPHKHGTFRQIPIALWIPGLSFLAEVLAVVTIYGGLYIIYTLHPDILKNYQNTLLPALQKIGVSLFPFLLQLLIVIPLINIFALWAWWRKMPLPFRLATLPLYGLIILTNLILPLSFLLVALSYRGF
jgi:hypothetical protein